MVAVLLMNRIPWIVVVRWKLCDPRCAAYQSGMRRSGLTHIGGQIPRHPDFVIRHQDTTQVMYFSSTIDTTNCHHSIAVSHESNLV